MIEHDDFHIHLDLMGEEVPELDLRIMGVFGAMKRGMSKNAALAKYKISAEEYDANVDRVMNS